MVYNIEVHKDHTYFVSELKLWVHNICVPALPKGGKWAWSDSGVTFDSIFERRGDKLTLWEVNLDGEVGTGTWKSVLDQIKEMARADGVKVLRLGVKRTSGKGSRAQRLINIQLDT